MTEPNYMRVDLGGGREELRQVTYPGNSKKKKKPAGEALPPKEVKRVVTGEVTQRKKSVWSRAKDSMIQENIGSLIVMSVLLPAFKNMMSDTVRKTLDTVGQSFDTALYGEGSRIRAARGDRPGGSINYTSMIRARPEPVYGTISPRGRATHELSEVLIPTRAEAEDVLAALVELVNIYQVATVQDFYSTVGITGEFADEKWGWDNLDRAGIRPVRNGFVLDLPRPKPIDS